MDPNAGHSMDRNNSKDSLKNLQLVQNAALRLLTVTRKREHISLILASFTGSLLNPDMNLKFFFLTYILNNHSLYYLKVLIVPYHSIRALSDCWLTCGKLFKIRMEGRARPLFCGTNPKFGLERVRERDTLYF